MSSIAVLIAAKQGGLAAVAKAAGDLEIIPGTVQEYDDLSTFSDPVSTQAGHVSSPTPGWIAFARWP